MQMKDRFTLKIESIAFGGSGVGRAEGLVIFVFVRLCCFVVR